MAGSTLAKTDTSEIQLTITIPQQEVGRVYEAALEETAKTTEISGFRKGKAPKDIVEQRVGKDKIYQQVVQKLIPQVYSQAVKEHKLKPVIPPRVELLKAQEGQDWQFRATTAERPKVELGNYKEKVKKALAPTKLWAPDKGKLKEENKPTQEEKTQKVIQALLEEVKVTIPPILTEEEVNRALANLINQTNSLGMTVDQYLASIGKSGEQIREEYRQKIEQDLKLQFALNAIAEKEEIKVDKKEIDDLIQATGDQKIKESLDNPLQRVYIEGVLKRRKVLDFLAKL